MRQPSKRLGINGSEEVKGHPWFKNFDWEALRQKTIKPTYIPDQNKENFDDKHVKRDWNDTEEVHEHQSMLRRPSKKEVFNSYYFDKTKVVRKPTIQSRSSKMESQMDDYDDEMDCDPGDNVLGKGKSTTAEDFDTSKGQGGTDAGSMSDNILANKW